MINNSNSETIKNILKIEDDVERIRHRHVFFTAAYNELERNRKRNISFLVNYSCFGVPVPKHELEPFVDEIDDLVMWSLLLKLNPSDNIPPPRMRTTKKDELNEGGVRRKGKPIEMPQEDDIFGFWCRVARHYNIVRTLRNRMTALRKDPEEGHVRGLPIFAVRANYPGHHGGNGRNEEGENTDEQNVDGKNILLLVVPNIDTDAIDKEMLAKARQAKEYAEAVNEYERIKKKEDKLWQFRMVMTIHNMGNSVSVDGLNDVLKILYGKKLRILLEERRNIGIKGKSFTNEEMGSAIGVSAETARKLTKIGNALHWNDSQESAA